jgi:hypothetical protein
MLIFSTVDISGLTNLLRKCGYENSGRDVIFLTEGINLEVFTYDFTDYHDHKLPYCTFGSNHRPYILVSKFCSIEVNFLEVSLYQKKDESDWQVPWREAAENVG